MKPYRESGRREEPKPAPDDYAEALDFVERRSHSFGRKRGTKMFSIVPGCINALVDDLAKLIAASRLKGKNDA